MREIGIIASDSSETEARVILKEEEEKMVRVEDLVLIENRNGNKILAVCRRGLGSNENLRAGGYHPGVAYARIGGLPSTAKEAYDFKLAVIGEVKEGLLQNKKIIAPASAVQVFEEKDDPMPLLATDKYQIRVGHYEGHPNWRVPVKTEFIPYHIGVFASTGGGKSFLARCLIVPLLKEGGYDIIIFDWKGRDYVPKFKEKVIKLSEMAFDDDAITSYLTNKMGNFGYSSKEHVIKQALGEFVSDGRWRSPQQTPEGFKALLEQEMVATLNPKQLMTGEAANLEARFRRGLKKLRDDDVRSILGTMTPEDILTRARKEGILVIDTSQVGKDEKLSAFLTLANHLMGLMQESQELNLALLIDEGPQYCPFKPSGIEEETTNIIIEMCALGRTYKLCICLLSQGIAGEIGINAAVRRNLNTQFIGKIHPLDMNEAGQWLSQFDLDVRFLLSLPPGHFYFMGNMNPSPVPLLITFEPDVP